MISVIPIQWPEDPIVITYMACRQCYSKLGGKELFENVGTTDREKMTTLVKKVLDSGHHSVLEHLHYTFAVSGISRAASHQLVRHRIASYSQQSQRYCNMGDGGFVVPDSVNIDPKASRIFNDALKGCREAYKALVALGVPQGDARFILPNASLTAVIISMNARSLLNFFELRTCGKAQWEIRKVAKAIQKHCKLSCPEIFGNSGPPCKTGKGCRESQPCKESR